MGVIAGLVSRLGKGEVNNLRASHPVWRATCDAQTTLCGFDAVQWKQGVTLVHRLPKLASVTICGNHSLSGGVEAKNALGKHMPDLTSLTIAPQHSPPHIVQQHIRLCLGKFLVRQGARLEVLHLSHCHVTVRCGQDPLGSPGFFSHLPRLRVLHLDSVHRLPSSPLQGLRLIMCTTLEALTCTGCYPGTLNVTGCTRLTSLDCSHNRLTTLDLSSCTALHTLNYSSNRLSAFDLTSCPGLTSLHCSCNQVWDLDVAACPALQRLFCSRNQMLGLAMGGCPNLVELECKTCWLSQLDVNACTRLEKLVCSDNGNCNAISLSACTRLQMLDCRDSSLVSLILPPSSDLRVVNC